MSTAVVNERLAALTASGTSVWLDQIGRNLIATGEMRRLVDEYCLRGVTSNPSIFEQAILHSGDYEDELRELAGEGLSAVEIYRRIAVHDVQQAADVLRPVWDRSGGADGFVSLEVSPDLARDITGRTLAEAREYWGLVDRPNLMIKIPGTPEGLPAIEEAIYDGINVNITLLFSVEAYAQVAEAFIRGLERRHADGKPVNVHSVASFFVSRVDSAVDKQLAELGREDLQGQAALANARAAYRHFKEIFHGERFAALATVGAPVQRPLWASTGTKNPNYSPVLYVDNLAGPETVNTMPMKTLMAAAEMSEVTAPAVEEDPTPVLQALAEAGIDLEAVTAQLLDDGIEAFVHSLDGLIEGIEQIRPAAAAGDLHPVKSSLTPELENAIADRISDAHDEKICERIWNRDATLWGPPGAPEIADRLGWLAIADEMAGRLHELSAWAGQVHAAGYEQIVLLGMGGSSLGPEVLRRSFDKKLLVLDSTDPEAVLAVEEAIDLERTLFVVSSKSGGTIETLSHFRYFLERSGGNASQFAVVTDPGSPLAQLAEDLGVNHVWLNDPQIGGRYSVMSYFGLVPAVLAGAPASDLIASCLEGERECKSETAANTGLWLGLAFGELALQGRDKLTFLIDPPIESFGLWAEQLIAESTGKNARGIVPIVDEPAMTPGDYGQDRVFIHLRVDGANDEHAGLLASAGQPVFTLDTTGPSDLGRLFFLFEFATAVAGHVLGVNPFDQPNVQEAKDATAAALESGELEVPTDTLDELAQLLGGAAPPVYIAIQGYAKPSAGFDEAISELRELITHRTVAATTFGYGPRYLHSTGQLHKGGPPVGRFIQLIHDGERDVAVPEANFTFRSLKHAQAAGDLQALRLHDLPVVRIQLTGADAVSSLRELTGELRSRLEG